MFNLKIQLLQIDIIYSKCDVKIQYNETLLVIISILIR